MILEDFATTGPNPSSNPAAGLVILSVTSHSKSLEPSCNGYRQPASSLAILPSKLYYKGSGR